jgi:hypothetical protein
MYLSHVDTKNPWNIFLARCVSVILLFAGLTTLWFENRFIRLCSTTIGIINSKPIEFHDHFGRHAPIDEYSFDYTFSANGKNYAGRGIMDYDPGKTVTVYYNRINPTDNTLDEPNTRWGRNITVVGMLFTLCFFPWRWIFKIDRKVKNE